MFKILHFADLHLDSSFAGLGLSNLIARKYREALRESLIRIIDIALEKKVDIVTIAGDLYEHERFSKDTGEFLRSQLRRLGGIKTYISPGNHDPWMPESLYHYIDWPSNVHIFQSSTFTPFQIAPEITLWGMAHRSFANHENPVENFQIKGQGKHVLLFHGSEMSNIDPQKGRHAPFNMENLVTTNTDIALLGHYHRGKMDKKNDVKYVYPGSPEPLGFSEIGTHSVALVTISREAIDIETIPVNKYNFVQTELDVSQAMTRDDVKNQIEQCIQNLGGKTAFLKIELTGLLNPEIDLDIQVLKEQVFEHCADGQLINNSRPYYDFESLSQERTVRGEFVRKIQTKQQNAGPEEKEKLQQALLVGLNAFENRNN